MKVVSAQEALGVVKSGDRVFVHTAVAAPQVLVQALTDRASELKDVNLYHLHTEGPASYADPSLSVSFTVNSLFIGANVRKSVQQGYGSYIPIFLSEAPRLFRRGIIPLNVALISVSPPDQHGFCSLGVSIDTTLAALEVADVGIAQVNRVMLPTGFKV
ncbi:MAG: 4-hydroxybutyrate CoA-transferase, partial [Bacteroidota bacterium]